MSATRGIKRLLFGIELTIMGIALVAAASGSGGNLGLGVAVIGLVVAASGMLPDPPS